MEYCVDRENLSEPRNFDILFWAVFGWHDQNFIFGKKSEN